MSKANDVRRLRAKIRLLEQEGIGSVLVDFLNYASQAMPRVNQKQPYWMQELVGGFKHKLEKDLQDLIDNGPLEQGKLL